MPAVPIYFRPCLTIACSHTLPHISTMFRMRHQFSKKVRDEFSIIPDSIPAKSTPTSFFCGYISYNTCLSLTESFLYHSFISGQCPIPAFFFTQCGNAIMNNIAIKPRVLINVLGYQHSEAVKIVCGRFLWTPTSSAAIRAVEPAINSSSNRSCLY